MSAPSTVARKAGKIFPHHELEAVMAILDEYGIASHETGRARVQLAILKVFQEGTVERETEAGRLERLRRLVAAAKADYRDVLAWAEYPREIRTGPVEMRKLSPEQQRRLRQEDREQYRRWLRDEYSPEHQGGSRP